MSCARCHTAPRKGQDSYCHECRRDLTREWRARNPARAAALAAHHNAKRPTKGQRRFWRLFRPLLEVQS